LRNQGLFLLGGINMIQLAFHEWEYDEKIKRLKETIKHIELARILACQELESLENENLVYHPIEVHSFTSQVIQICDFEVFQMKIPNPLPMYDEKDQRYLKQLKDFYVPRIVNSIRNQKTKIRYEKPFVLIHQYFPDLKIRDLDNRSKRFIFNGLRQGKIIIDDSWNKMEYMEMGSLDRDHPRTEIYLCESSNKIDLLKFMSVQSVSK